MMSVIALLALLIVVTAAQWVTQIFFNLTCHCYESNQFPLTVPNPLRRLPQLPQNTQQVASDVLGGTFAAPQYNRGPLAFLLMQHYLSRNVTLEQRVYLGRSALKVVRNDAFHEIASHHHTYVELPLTTFYEGTINMDVAIVRNDRSNELSASAGLAFRMHPDDRYDLVYLRTANELFHAIQPANDRSVIQYMSSPYWTPNKLRLEHPLRYEAAARVFAAQWNRIKIHVQNETLSVFVGTDTLPIIKAPLLGSLTRGAVAYWVGDGTDAFFSGLVIREGNFYP